MGGGDYHHGKKKKGSEESEEGEEGKKDHPPPPQKVIARIQEQTENPGSFEKRDFHFSRFCSLLIDAREKIVQRVL